MTRNANRLQNLERKKTDWKRLPIIFKSIVRRQSDGELHAEDRYATIPGKNGMRLKRYEGETAGDFRTRVFEARAERQASRPVGT